ncbi:FecR domain-containing protein [Pigmentiphaga sp. H8]|uniref:FecR domain-containing protein n=1 Tax=Pigmentiphaga sp. H8 TaxID=2488560 RepID=UPI001EDF4037|nr:FecR domain-containing protein [Pigmentiphaga sp. H8]
MSAGARPASIQLIDRRAAREAARWLLRLRGAGAGEGDHVACLAWRSARPENEAAWQKAQRLGQQLDAMPSGLAMPVLDRTSRQRRAALKKLALLLAGVPAGWLAYRETPWRAWAADYRTAVGERRRVVLADGSILDLNTATAVDAVFGAERRLRLRGGEIMIATAPDPQAPPRPFVVDTGAGRVRAIGTRFIVRQAARDTFVAVFEGAVMIQPAAPDASALRLEAGQETSFGAQGARAPVPRDPRRGDWSRGVLRASGMRLADFCEELGRHMHGVLRCEPEVADLRISGVFQLADREAALAAVPTILPVRIRRLTRYWVSIGPRD